MRRSYHIHAQYQPKKTSARQFTKKNQHVLSNWLHLYGLLVNSQSGIHSYQNRSLEGAFSWKARTREPVRFMFTPAADGTQVVWPGRQPEIPGSQGIVQVSFLLCGTPIPIGGLRDPAACFKLSFLRRSDAARTPLL